MTTAVVASGVRRDAIVANFPADLAEKRSPPLPTSRFATFRDEVSHTSPCNLTRSSRTFLPRARLLPLGNFTRAVFFFLLFFSLFAPAKMRSYKGAVETCTIQLEAP